MLRRTIVAFLALGVLLAAWPATPADAPDGTAFTVFVATLDTEPCFAGYCDWRLPTIDELQSLNEAPTDGCGGPSLPCYSIPGATASGNGYWSTTDGFTNSPSEVNAWFPDQRSTFPTDKNGVGVVRAVRGGASPSATVAAPPPRASSARCVKSELPAR